MFAADKYVSSKFAGKAEPPMPQKIIFFVSGEIFALTESNAAVNCRGRFAMMS